MPATTMRPLTSDHPKIEQFLRLWHENGGFRLSVSYFTLPRQHMIRQHPVCAVFLPHTGARGNRQKAPAVFLSTK
jgi:hypothetical protein